MILRGGIRPVSVFRAQLRVQPPVIRSGSWEASVVYSIAYMDNDFFGGYTRTILPHLNPTGNDFAEEIHSYNFDYRDR